uniref:Uncharacterized protein n=1 Tax=Anguilla anguilla TaxID=7936 RepID=A0A0E9WFU2_ANGAN
MMMKMTMKRKGRVPAVRSGTSNRKKMLENRPGELLLWASERNRLVTVKRLLSADPLLVHSRDEDRYTPPRTVQRTVVILKWCGPWFTMVQTSTPVQWTGGLHCTVPAGGTTSLWPPTSSNKGRRSTPRRMVCSPRYT